MFRLFLRKKIFGGPANAPQGADLPPPRRNRRVYTRYNVDHKHLTMMNEHDILLIQDISAKGFSTLAAPRALDRLSIGDVYEARMRYVGEMYDLQARVTWKNKNSLGFELVEANRETLSFITRLLRPMAIANSFQVVAKGNLATSQAGKIWYHGDEASDLYIWQDQESKRISAWELAIGDIYVAWNLTDGFHTGRQAASAADSTQVSTDFLGVKQTPDPQVDPRKKQLAVDILMAFPSALGTDLLATITG